MASEATPRINAQYLDSFTNQAVRILGKVTSLRGETATIDANGSITIHLNRDSHLTLNNAVEVVGKVQQDLSIRVFQATDFGDKIGAPLLQNGTAVPTPAMTDCSWPDFKAVEAVVDATHRYKEIFYESND